MPTPHETLRRAYEDQKRATVTETDGTTRENHVVRDSLLFTSYPYSDGQSPTRPMFDEEHFPREYRCQRCGRTGTVTHKDVQYVPSYLYTRSATAAAEYVISRRGWSLGSMAGTLCSECVGGALSE